MSPPVLRVGSLRGRQHAFRWRRLAGVCDHRVVGLEGRVALVSDTRISGISHGAIGVHCAPEAAVGGPIALVEDGDEISFDLLAGNVTLHVVDELLAKRKAAWRPRESQPTRGYLADFTATVSQATAGCVSRAMYPTVK